MWKYIGVLLFCLLTPLLIYTKAHALDKKESGALSHYIMAVVYEDSGDIDKAIQEYKKVLSSDEKSSIVHLNLASSYIKKNEPSQAIEELNIAAELSPDSVEPHAILALLYSSQDKIELATDEYEKALTNASKLQPKNVDIYKGLGAIYLKQKKFKEAQRVYKLITDLSPNDAEAHFYLGSILNELKNDAQSEKELKRALELRPDYPEALNFLGYVYVEAGKNLERAEVMLKKALEIAPSNGAYIDSLGWLYFKQGKFQESIKELEKAATLLQDPVIYDHLGDVYQKIGESAKAKINWQKSLKLDEKQDRVKEKLKKVEQK
jgi:tetratricopeptide (TPR) repeat protein